MKIKEYNISPSGRHHSCLQTKNTDPFPQIIINCIADIISNLQDYTLIFSVPYTFLLIQNSY